MKKLLLIAGIFAHAFTSASDKQALPPAIQNEEMNRLLLTELQTMNANLKNANTISTQAANYTLQHQSAIRQLKLAELNNNPVFRVTQCLCFPYRYISDCISNNCCR